MPRMPKVCVACERPLTGRRNKKFHDDRCRSDFHNAKKSEPRLAVIAAQNGICALRGRGCSEKATRYHPELWTDINPHGYALCDFHSAEYVRFKRREARGLTELEELIEEQRLDIEDEERGKDRTLRTAGAMYYGYEHISIDDAVGLEVYLYDPISELVDYLSGEKDEMGNALFHPLDEAA